MYTQNVNAKAGQKAGNQQCQEFQYRGLSFYPFVLSLKSADIEDCVVCFKFFIYPAINMNFLPQVCPWMTWLGPPINFKSVGDATVD